MKGFLSRLGATTPAGADIALLVVRLGFGLTLALNHGWPKVAEWRPFTENLVGRGLPYAEVLGPAAISAEVLGGLLVAVGLLTRLGALGVLATMGVAYFHIHAADPFKSKELALLYGVVALALVLSGPGRFSLDAALFKPAGGGLGRKK